jgi:hypothetical protein
MSLYTREIFPGSVIYRRIFHGILMRAISRAGGIPRVRWTSARYIEVLLITFARFNSWNSRSRSARSISENITFYPHTRGSAACVIVGRNARRPTDFAVQLDIPRCKSARGPPPPRTAEFHEKIKKKKKKKDASNRHNASVRKPTRGSFPRISRRRIEGWRRRLNVTISWVIQLVIKIARLRKKETVTGGSSEI